MTWPRWINLLLGIWLLIAPAALGYVDAYAANNDHLLGMLVAISAAVALWLPKVRYLNVAFGVWLIVAPFVLGYFGSRSVANDIVVGIAIAVFAFIPSQPITRAGAGGSTLGGGI
jgi:general stress protein CsbA